jgi:hypothetical protein
MLSTSAAEMSQLSRPEIPLHERKRDLRRIASPAFLLEITGPATNVYINTASSICEFFQAGEMTQYVTD